VSVLALARRGDTARSCVMGAVRRAGSRHTVCVCTGTGQEGCDTGARPHGRIGG